MKKIYTITLGVFLCLTLVSAGLGGQVIMKKWNKNIELESHQVDRIKSSSNVTNIDVNISEITCDNVDCWASINQPRVINTQWRRSRNYCSQYSECGDDPECETECLTYTDYTTEENQEAIKEYINERLSLYANAEEKRKGNARGEEVIQSGIGKVSQSNVLINK